jgi:hypothetical protein
MTETHSKETVMMDEPVELNGMIDNPTARRLWLLHNALRDLPFDRAIELARAAEAFVAGSSVDNQADDIRVNTEAPEAPGLEPTEQLITEISAELHSVEQPIIKKSAGLALSMDRRDQLLDRLAQDAKNAELAAEFGVTSKQVQGIRMGCAREIAKRRDQRTRNPMHPDRAPPQTARVEDIVRYLRQQDDVVVSQEDGSYLVNGRFRMSLAELTKRANRMRSRHRKPAFAFELLVDKPGPSEKKSSATGHPVFWKKPSPASAS